jgi:His-Xaa-Ser repeat protein HxsA
MSRAFLIPSLLVAGFGKVSPEQVTFTTLARDTSDPGTSLFQVYRQSHLVTLAQHRSHSSHSSHRSGYSSGHYSHSSHRSSYGGGYGAPAPSAPAPVYSRPSSSSPSTDTVRPQALYGSNPESSSATSSDGTTLATLSGRTKKFEQIVRLVQIGLMAQGDYNGPLNGAVGPLTRSALRKFQESHSLSVTGTITPETLDALRVPSQ